MFKILNIKNKKQCIKSYYFLLFRIESAREKKLYLYTHTRTKITKCNLHSFFLFFIIQMGIITCNWLKMTRLTNSNAVFYIILTCWVHDLIVQMFKSRMKLRQLKKIMNTHKPQDK